MVVFEQPVKDDIFQWVAYSNSIKQVFFMYKPNETQLIQLSKKDVTVMYRIESEYIAIENEKYVMNLKQMPDENVLKLMQALRVDEVVLRFSAASVVGGIL